MAQMFSAQAVITINKLPQIASGGKLRVSQALRRAGYATQRYAAPLTPVRTGALKANVIVSADDSTCTVRWGQEYAIYQEFGTRRGIPPKAFARGGAEQAWPTFRADCEAAYRGGI
jgi:hypothetical protein